MIDNFISKEIQDKIAIVIPIRMNSTRLPGKFHQDIGEKPMIVHVLEKAQKTNLKNIYVAVDDPIHFDLIKKYGGVPVMTSIDHQSGTDRVHEAINTIDPQKNIEFVINLQGDMPFISVEYICEVIKLTVDNQNDIATLASPINNKDDINNPNVVKIALANHNGKALYFSRAPIPYNTNKYYHHLGIYGFKRGALNKFVKLEQSNLEKIEKLEQLRALENNMTIFVKEIENETISVDTPDDLTKAREYINNFLFNT